jgi:hypothetical protein
LYPCFGVRKTAEKEVREGMETTANVASAYRPRRGDKQYGRSRITNGGELLPGVDQRSRWVRRCRDVIAAHLSDLGGEDNTSEAERSIVRRAAVLTTELEQLEVRFATAGEASAFLIGLGPPDVDQHALGRPFEIGDIDHQLRPSAWPRQSR